MEIKAKAHQLVKLLSVRPRVGVAILAALLTGGGELPRIVQAAEEPSESTPPLSVVPSPADPLPLIEARVFDVRVVRHSRSERVYLFDDVSDSKTRPGKILLLRKDNNPVMAFRVIRTYAEKKQIAAKRVRRYGDVKNLDNDATFSALEKVLDIPLPPQTAQDKADLKELENPNAVPTAPGPEVHPFDPDLDAGSSPPPGGTVDSDQSKDTPFRDDDDEDQAAHLGLAIEETNPLDPNTHWLTGGVGYLRNGAPDGTSAFYLSGGLRYGLTLGKMIFLRRAKAQDSIVAEAGLFFYRIIGFQKDTESYDVMPLLGTARYNIQFSENFAIFFYGGVVQNRVIRTNGDNAHLLSMTFPTAGGGFLFRVGPNWDARVDLGYDTATLGLVLRF
ncbi:hypothetical protein WDW37_18070 [Bdellovibrionota bacterium FG-1]